MDRFRTIYAFVDDLGEIFYVGQCRDFYFRLAKHRRELDERQHLRVYRHIKEIKAAGGTAWVQVLAVVPDDTVYALCLEALIIEDIGLIEDGGTLLNSRRSSIGPAGYIEESIRRISNAAKRQWQRDRDRIIAAQNAGKANPEAKERHRQAHVGKRPTAETRAKMSAGQRASYASGKRNEAAHRPGPAKQWQDPGWRAKQLEKIREGQKRAWADGTYSKRSFSEEGRERHRQACLRREQQKRATWLKQPVEE